MTATLRTVTITLAGAAALLTALPAAAQQQGQPRPPAAATPRPPAPSTGPLPVAVVAVVDMQLIMRETAAGRSIREQLDRHRQTYQNEVTAKERELKSQQEELLRQRASLSAEAFNERRRQFDQRAADFQKMAQSRKASLDRALQAAIKEVETVGTEVLRQIAAERGINLVVSRQAIALSANQLDITEDLRQRLDRRLTRVNVRVQPLQN